MRVIFRGDHLLVTNSGAFVIDPRLAIRGGISSPRNPTLMRILCNLGRIDRAGTGPSSAWGLREREFGSAPTIDRLCEPIEVRVTAPLDSTKPLRGGAIENGSDKPSDNVPAAIKRAITPGVAIKEAITIACRR